MIRAYSNNYQKKPVRSKIALLCSLYFDNTELMYNIKWTTGTGVKMKDEKYITSELAIQYG